MANGNVWGMRDPEAWERFRGLALGRDDISMEESIRRAPEEHEAFAEMWVRERPLIGPAEMLGFVPAYYAAKKLGLMTDDTTTPPSLEQMAAGYRGLGRGLQANVQDLARTFSAAPGTGPVQTPAGLLPHPMADYQQGLLPALRRAQGQRGLLGGL